VTPDQVRSRIAAWLTVTLGDAWSEAPVPYQVFPANLTRTKAHRAFAVGLGATQAVDGHGSRQRDGVVVETEVGVRIALRVRGATAGSDPATLNDVDAALRAEADVVQAILRVKDRALDPGLILRFDRVSTRDLVAEGTYWLGEIRAVALHVYPS
jgi:hypothetical protein